MLVVSQGDFCQLGVVVLFGEMWGRVLSTCVIGVCGEAWFY